MFTYTVLFVFFSFLGFQERVPLCSLSCPETHSVDQAGFKLRDLPASASRVLGLKGCATTVWRQAIFPSGQCQVGGGKAVN